MLLLEENKMNDFKKINVRRVRHSSGYEVYSIGRDFIGYEDATTIYKIRRELGWLDAFNKGAEIIYINDIYDKESNTVSLTTLERNLLMEKIVSARKFIGGFEIQLSG